MQTQQPPNRDPYKPAQDPKENTPTNPDKGGDKSRPLPGTGK
jgi:hypothetical protein